MKNRIEYIDQLKGLAIILVVMGHVCSHSFSIDGTGFNYFYSSFHMPLFAFLSGIFSYKGFKEWNNHELLLFFKKKTCRIIIPFIWWGFCLSLCMNKNLTDVYTGKIAALWFLPAIFYCMVTGVLANKIANSFKTKNELLLSITINVIIYLLLIYFYYSHALSNVYFYLSFIKLYPFFILGYLYERYKNIQYILSENQLSLSLSFFCFALCWIYKDVVNSKIALSGFFAINILIYYFKSNENTIPNILSIIGRNSLEIYIFHWFLLPSLSTISDWFITNKQLNIDISNNFIILASISFIVTVPIIVACMIFTNIIKQSKYIRLIGFGELY